MLNYEHLLTIAQKTAREAMQSLVKINSTSINYKYDSELPREMKSEVDYELEKIILKSLNLTKIPIISEEMSYSLDSFNRGLCWVVDPLDGTVNFIRGIAPCSISIALWDDMKPIFGVIIEYPSCKLAWGGAIFGSFIDDKKINVSAIEQRNRAILCTGFPSRFNFSESSMSDFLDTFALYSKVRMLGAASLSLLHVAKGSADVYFEKDIMIWDVAAGLAIVEGAGGVINISSGNFQDSFNVFASNDLIKSE